MCFLDLPVRALFPGRFLFGLQLCQQGAADAELIFQASPGKLTGHECLVDLGQPLGRAGDAVAQALELRLRFGGFSGEIAHESEHVLACRKRLPLGISRLLGGRSQLCQATFPLGQLLGGLAMQVLWIAISATLVALTWRLAVSRFSAVGG